MNVNRFPISSFISLFDFHIKNIKLNNKKLAYSNPVTTGVDASKGYSLDPKSQGFAYDQNENYKKKRKTMKIEKNLEHAEIDATRINKNPSAESREILSDDISLREDENKLYALLMEGITEQYQEVIDAVTVFVNQEEGKELDDIKLSFVIEEEKRAIAWANSQKNEVTFNLPRYFKPKVLRVATHEIAHIICDKYVKPSLGHSLEFAIITYCLDYKLDICKNNFLISYDIHEDIAYNFLRINPCEFDALIRCISWNSIRELAEKAKLVAEKIRTENVPLNLYKGEKL